MIIYLYHKRHKLTGLNYFGKTKRDPYKYVGSGLYWRRHLKEHGKHIETVSVWQFTDVNECVNFAINFSALHNIVVSDEWANLKIENGLDGGFPELSTVSRLKGVSTRKNKGSYIQTDVAKEKRKSTLLERYGSLKTFTKHTQQSKDKLSVANTGRRHTKEELKKMSESHLGSKNAFAKLNETQVIDIKHSNKSALELSIIYNVSRSLIYKIKSGSIWSHI